MGTIKVTVTTASTVTNGTLKGYKVYSDAETLDVSMNNQQAGAGHNFTALDVLHHITVKPVVENLSGSDVEIDSPSAPVTVDLSVSSAPTPVIELAMEV